MNDANLPPPDTNLPEPEATPPAQVTPMPQIELDLPKPELPSLDDRLRYIQMKFPDRNLFILLNANPGDRRIRGLIRLHLKKVMPLELLGDKDKISAWLFQEMDGKKILAHSDDDPDATMDLSIRVNATRIEQITQTVTLRYSIDVSVPVSVVRQGEDEVKEWIEENVNVDSEANGEYETTDTEITQSEWVDDEPEMNWGSLSIRTNIGDALAEYDDLI